MDWKTALEKKLDEINTLDRTRHLSMDYVFPHSYTDAYTIDQAVFDLEYFEKLNPARPLDSFLYRVEGEPADRLHWRLFQSEHHTPLSDVLPIIENMGLKTDNVVFFKINKNQQKYWVSDFELYTLSKEVSIEGSASLFHEAFYAIFSGLAENDGFNKLILSSMVSWREVMLIRAYVKYLVQVRFRYSPMEIEKTLLNNNLIVKDLICLFKALHCPVDKQAQAGVEQTQLAILNQLDAITSLDEDRILRRFFELIKATLRTNYFKTETHGDFSPYLALKLSSRDIPDLPLPTPLYEIFVYSPRFEAIHLRNTKVARGGIRWSERIGDFRTEILGLMKAQVVKNALIVPSGAKGGFVLKSPPVEGGWPALQREVIVCYELFIRGLLDLTDNIVNNETVPPAGIVCRDEADPYLVVAADKGTATFSDRANALSRHYHFWLGDAFATGGSEGYDHKKMGITARGAWESIKRHFSELGIDIKTQTFTMVGIGDMSGDVFGNGTLYTDKIALVAAFDHRHIFIDPHPDTERSYKERYRLYHLSTSSWNDYNKSLISKGGGVFSRTLKKITVTPEMKAVLGIEEDNLTPNGLIRSILKAPVDLLYNGGIGTYVKSTEESHADVGDKTNDYCRVNGMDLRARAAGEGGNLGFTGRGRVEYALKGGLIYADFIDNSGGVDCSDHEVNLKILMDKEVVKGNISEEARNELLASLTQQVAELVLADNYSQALTLSFSAFSAKETLTLHTEYINELELRGLINRLVDGIPDAKALSERRSLAIGLTRPELATLFAYTKIDLKHQILKSSIPDEPVLYSIRASAFPGLIHESYRSGIQNHPLVRDITATQLSNKIVNKMGITFIYRLQIESGASVEEIIRAYLVSIEIFETDKLKEMIESLDNRISLPEQYEMLTQLRKLLNISTRWFLQHHLIEKDIDKTILHYKDKIKSLEPLIPELMGGMTKQYLTTLFENFSEAGLPHEIAQRVATYRAIYTALNVIKVSTTCSYDLITTAKIYFRVGEHFRLLWFRDKIARDNQEGHWNTLARLNIRDELDVAQRKITIAIMESYLSAASAESLFEAWIEENSQVSERWNKLLEILHGQSDVTYIMMFIALRELLRLIPGDD